MLLGIHLLYLQMKKKVHLKKYRRQCHISNQTNRVNGGCSRKRNRQNTPKKSSFAYKSPFKSPLYHQISQTPVVKRLKATKTLFSRPDCDKNTNSDLRIDIYDNWTDDIELDGIQLLPDDDTCNETSEEPRDQVKQSKLIIIITDLINIIHRRNHR